MSVMTLHSRSIANPWRVSFISLNVISNIYINISLVRSINICNTKRSSSLNSHLEQTKGGQSSVNDTRIFLNGMLPHSPVHSSHCRTQIALLQVATRPNGLVAAPE